MTVRLLYLVSHPIQYQAPLLRLIAADPEIRLRVVFERVDTTEGYFDTGFARWLKWDVPLRDGYDSAAIAETDLERELAAADAVWLHGWQSPLFRQLLGKARRRGIPVLMRGENWDGAMPDGSGLRGLAKRLYLGHVFRHCTGFLTIGSRNRAYYLSHGVAAERLFAVPYAIDNDAFAAAAAAARPGRAALRQSLGLAPDRPILLYASKLIARKHPDWLVEAWRRAPWPDGRRPLLLFVGDGPLRAGLEADPDPDIHFLGFRNQSELPAFYDLADVFALPAEAEPWGLVVNEAMACGTAVVATDQVGAAHDLLDDGRGGAMVPAGDLDALASALVRVQADAAAMGEAARAKVAATSFAADLAGLRQALAWLNRRS
ncbi:MAG: glycosyltransferase [Candidatus Hydrogenedens sp.]|nr:glycosyltransferase [Candidatus Hydrogenedens sp.]